MRMDGVHSCSFQFTGQMPLGQSVVNQITIADEFAAAEYAAPMR